MKRLQVMIVDDELPMRENLRIFPYAEHSFVWVGDARNGEQALAAYQKLVPDIVITDIVMPKMNGIELTRRIREMNPRTQIILLTCHSEFHYAKDAIALGAVGYLLKGVYRDVELLEALHRARMELVKYDHYVPPSPPAEKAEASERRYEIEQALTYVHKHLDEPLSMAEIAGRAGLSVNYFGILFKKETGEYFQEHVKRVRLEKAAVLLRHTNLKVYEVAEQVGIPTYRYFTELFTKHFGMNPKDYR